MSNIYSRTSLANRALDLAGKETLLDLDLDTSTVAKLVQRQYPDVMLRCLRKSDWPFGIRRVMLNPSLTPPVNQYDNAFDLPAGLVRLCRIWPDQTEFKVEKGQILCNETSITIKYVDDAALRDPSIIDAAFAEYFAYELAVAISYKVSDSVNLRNELAKTAMALFEESAALYSQEDVDDPMPESPWVSTRVEPLSEDPLRTILDG